MHRRHFIRQSALASTATMLLSGTALPLAGKPLAKKKIALVGTGGRGIGFWGTPVVKNYGDLVEFVGLCDINPGRLKYARKAMGVECPVFSNFEDMMKTTKPELVIVTTVDSTHHEFIIKAMEMGADVVTEKPMTTDEKACKLILDAEKKTGKTVRVGMNYRYGSFFTGIKEQLMSGKIGKITSVDFHWYLNVYHGADYFRRWHRLKEKGGTLLVHKSSHHFDLVNWLLDSDPVDVFAFGALEHYGKNGSFRHTHCRPCPHKVECKFYMDITKRQDLMDIYVANEQHDGYLRDGCVFKEDINIYDKMSVQASYANEATLNYSLTTYSPYEGWRIAFNGTKGRLDASEGIPWEVQEVDQESLHAKEMAQGAKEKPNEFDKIYITTNFKQTPEVVKVERKKGGHGGGDVKLHDSIFGALKQADPLKYAAGTRDGAMSVLLGVAARQSIEQKKVVKIKDLTDIGLMAVRP
jgi:predicted dehydrogenase